MTKDWCQRPEGCSGWLHWWDPNHTRRLLAWLETMQLLFNLRTARIFLMMFTPSSRSVPCHWPDNCQRVCSCLGFFNLAVYIQQHNGLSPTQKHLRVINWERGGEGYAILLWFCKGFYFLSCYPNNPFIEQAVGKALCWGSRFCVGTRQFAKAINWHSAEKAC